MSRRYKVLLPLEVHTEDGCYTQGDEFEKDYTAAEEAEVLAWRGGGLLEVVPNRYRVVGSSNVDGHDPGEEFESDMTLAREELLVAGGHIERVEEKPKRKKKED
jgi:hypothetical protein